MNGGDEECIQVIGGKLIHKWMDNINMEVRQKQDGAVWTGLI
jgi:hypothetical protein